MIAVALGGDADAIPRRRGRLEPGAGLDGLDAATRPRAPAPRRARRDARFADARAALAELRAPAAPAPAPLPATPRHRAGLAASVLVVVGVAAMWAAEPSARDEDDARSPRAAAVIDDLNLLERDCDGGRADACLALSLRYSAGRGVARNHEAAARFRQRACSAGLKSALRVGARRAPPRAAGRAAATTAAGRAAAIAAAARERGAATAGAGAGRAAACRRGRSAGGGRGTRPRPRRGGR